MSTCRFCQREFVSHQAVRAHLKACAAYLGRTSRQNNLPQAENAPPVGSTLTHSGAPMDDFDPVRQVRQQLSAEQIRLKLREVRQAHNELDAREEAKRRGNSEQEAREAEARRSTEREREFARLQVQSEAEARQRAEEEKKQLNAKRREIIQDVKHTVVDLWFGGLNMSAELEAQILRAIETELVPLPVQELPKAELVKIAEGVRDRLYKRAVEARNAAAALEQKKQALQRYGQEYAERELKAEGLELTERWRIQLLVREELQELTGNEPRAEVMDWVDDILEEEDIEFDGDD